MVEMVKTLWNYDKGLNTKRIKYKIEFLLHDIFHNIIE
jgi:hypothetical protein